MSYRLLGAPCTNFSALTASLKGIQGDRGQVMSYGLLGAPCTNFSALTASLKVSKRVCNSLSPASLVASQEVV
jgi:hypothetical protein